MKLLISKHVLYSYTPSEMFVSSKEKPKLGEVDKGIEENCSCAKLLLSGSRVCSWSWSSIS